MPKSRRARRKRPGTAEPPAPLGARAKNRASRAARVAAWNLALLAGGATALLVAGEAWFRATQPFGRMDPSLERVPGVGNHFVSHSEVRWTNLLDYWVVSRTNNFGFLDREPPSPARARASCHVAVVGDSFVTGREVPLRDRMQVRVEEMAARRLPSADVTTAGWGQPYSGQIRQLAFWDKWIHRFSPKLVVLVFVDNDMEDNRLRRSGGRQFATVSLDPGGQVVLHWPDISRPAPPGGGEAWIHRLPFLDYVNRRIKALLPPPRQVIRPNWLQFTAFALDQWLERAQRAGASLVILASHSMRTTDWTFDGGESQFDWLAREAAKRRIPVIDQFDHIARSEGVASDAHWKYDLHWSSQGHQWAAEATLDWLEQNLWACGG